MPAVRRALAAAALVVAAGAPGSFTTGSTAHGLGIARAQAAHPVLPIVTTTAPAIGAAATVSGNGYWIATADGHVYAYGDATNFGDLSRVRLHAPLLGMVPTSDRGGYWLVASDGGIFTFGDARFHGSTGARRLHAPIVGMAATATGDGYWLVASDGGIFTFGDARFYGSTGAWRLRAPIVGMAPSNGGRGYFLAARDGGVFSFGAVHFHGSMASQRMSAGIVGIAASTHRDGYYLYSNDGSVFSFGAASNMGGIESYGHSHDIRALVVTPNDDGYWLLTGHGAMLPFGAADWYGSLVRARRTVVGRPSVRVYGDSLVTQATPDLAFRSLGAGLDVDGRDFIGTALCDWIPDMTDPTSIPVDVVVLAFSGNVYRPCVSAHADTDENVFVASYRRASLQALAVLASEGIRVVFVLPPPRLDVATTDALPALYSQIAAQWPMFAQSYDAGALVSGPHRVFTHTLPCLPFEGPELGCHGGEIQVRSDDGVHFCPGTLRDPKNLWSGCSVWSSGSWRYAGGIVDAARAGLR